MGLGKILFIFLAFVSISYGATPAFLEQIQQTVIQDQDFNKTYTKSGCYIRAHWIADLIQKQGHEPLKVFIQTESPKIKMQLKLPTGQQVKWVFHVTSGFRDSTGEIWLVDPVLNTEPVTKDQWLGLIQKQNPGIKIINYVTGPGVYHVDPSENEEFLSYSHGDPFSSKAMDFIRDGMNILFFWESLD